MRNPCVIVVQIELIRWEAFGKFGIYSKPIVNNIQYKFGRRSGVSEFLPVF